MAKVTFITGGARSGKSRLAEELALSNGAPLLYVATSEAGDGEMAERIQRHRLRRGDAWQTIEEPVALAETLLGHDGYFNAVLVDCITLWLTNLLLSNGDRDEALKVVRQTAGLFAGMKTPVYLVSNEVGMGIVPDNTLARTFRDLAGEANEILATAADEVFIMFSGLPLKLK